MLFIVISYGINPYNSVFVNKIFQPLNRISLLAKKDRFKINFQVIF